MITITKEGYKITVEGHAGYAPHGQDIVCSAVSTLFCAMAGGLSAHDELFTAPPCVLTKAGWAVFDCNPKKGAEDAVNLVWDIFESAFIALAAEYPAHICYKK